MTGGEGIQLRRVCFGWVKSGIRADQFRSAGLFALRCGAGGRMWRFLLRNHGCAEKLYLDISDKRFTS